MLGLLFEGTVSVQRKSGKMACLSLHWATDFSVETCLCAHFLYAHEVKLFKVNVFKKEITNGGDWKRTCSGFEFYELQLSNHDLIQWKDSVDAVCSGKMKDLICFNNTDMQRMN